MSPLTVRRYRAERLLRKEFEGLRGRVVGTVRGRLRASGVSLDASDLDACYAQAWQGLYAAMLAGEEITNPSGWLALVTFRRAIDEHRSSSRAYPTRGGGELSSERLRSAGREDFAGGTLEHDLAGELDDRTRLRQLFEGLRGRLSAREQQAATLCYLQGLSRSEAAARMEISEARMRKLMEGSGPGRPGVAGKVGELVETIRGGGWCEQQGSLMRGFAFGILDPEGERYRLALTHWQECPACRAYIRSLRGLAEVLPPLPALVHWVLGGGAAAGAAAGAHASAGHASAGHAGAGVGGGGVGAAGAGVGAAGAGGAAGGGWFLAGGGIGAKLAAGCLFVAFGAGCVALTGSPIVARHAVHHRHVEHVYGARAPVYQEALSSSIAGAQPVSDATAPARGGSSTSTRAGASTTLLPTAKASREFGPEQALAGSAASSTASSQSRSSAKAASRGGAAGAAESSSAGGSSSAGAGEFTSTATPASGGAPQARSSSSQGATGSGGRAAQHEFGIG
jgi:DNA-directed RNA polymerase specialized sigma24 family protein